MNEISYSGYRFPPEIIQQAIWLYVRFTLSFRDVEDLLAERGILVSYETVCPSAATFHLSRSLGEMTSPNFIFIGARIRSANKAAQFPVRMTI